MKKILLATLVGTTFAFAAVAGDDKAAAKTDKGAMKSDKAADKGAMKSDKAADKMMKRELKMTAMKDIKWSPMDPNNPKGPQVAAVDGDMSGPTHFLMKAPAGFKPPLHSHTADYSAVVVAGEWSHGNTESDAKTFGPGSSWVQPGKADHYDMCASKKEDCVVAIYVHGPMDFIVAPSTAAAPAPKK